MKETYRRAWVVLFIVLGAIAVTAVAKMMGGGTPAEAGLIHWTKDLPAAREQSKASGKPVLVYFTSADCGFCRALERDAWSDARVAAAVNDGYVPVKIDYETQSNVMREFGVQGFPRVDVMSADGPPFVLANGYVKRDEMLERLKPTKGK